MYSVSSRRAPRNLLNRTDGSAVVADVRELHLSQGAVERVVVPRCRGLPTGYGESARLVGSRRSTSNSNWQGSRCVSRSNLSCSSKFALARWRCAALPLHAAAVDQPLAGRRRLLTVIAYFLPDYVIGKKAVARQLTIQRDLADSLDQITMSVEAGLGFEGAIERVVGAGSGPLNDELRRMLLEMQLGASRSDALRHLADRTDVPDLKSFVFAIVQSEAYGLPIATGPAGPGRRAARQAASSGQRSGR